MSFWKKLFGGGGEAGGNAAAPEVGDSESYKGFTIRARLMPVGSEYQLAGVIEKEIDGETRTYEFVRADRFSSRDEVQSYALTKGRQIIDEQGNFLFPAGSSGKPN